MDTAVLAALIAGGISIIGGIATVLVSRSQAKKEMNLRLEEIRLENNRTYSEQLLQRRLDIYPTLNAIIMEFMHSIRSDGMRLDHIESLRNGLMDWEIQHSLMLTFKSREELTHLVKHLRIALNGGPGTPEIAVLKEIINGIRNLGLQLKGDLGIFRVEFKDSEDGYFRSEDELFAFQQKEEQDKAEAMAEESTEPEEVDEDEADSHDQTSESS